VQLATGDEGLLAEFSEPGFADLARRRPVFVVLMDGRVVSACTSSRENVRAAEAWVFTDPSLRGRGLGRAVAAVWASFAVRNGKVAFYSHDEENTASGSIARALNLEHWLSSVIYDVAD
jgi:predicted GNAT family acetyltransferase